MNQGLYGAALLWGWSFLYFLLNQSDIGRTGNTAARNISLADTVSLFSIIAISIAIVASARWIGTLDRHTWIAYAACVLLVAGIILRAVSWLSDQEIIWLYVLGSIFIGIGQEAFWIVWGELLTRCEVEDVENAFLSWLPILTLLFLVVVVLEVVFIVPKVFLAIFFTLLPIGSLIAFRRAIKVLVVAPVQRRDIAREPSESESGSTRMFIYFGIIFAIIAFIWNDFSLQAHFTFETLVAIFALGIICAFIIMWRVLMTTCSFSLLSLLRWALPAMVLSVALSTITDIYTMLVAYLCLTAINVGFVVMMKLYFVRMAQRCPEKAVKIIGIGFMVAAIGGIIGQLIESLVSLISSDIEPISIMLLALFLFALITMAVSSRESVVSRAGVDVSIEMAPISTSDEILIAKCHSIAAKYGLSPRETDVMFLLAQGRSRAYIRETLFISKGTVDAHAHSIYSKIGIRSKDMLMNMVIDDSGDGDVAPR